MSIDTIPTAPRANAGVRPAYRVPVAPGAIDLWLAGNEGRAPERLDLAPVSVDRYPDAAELERLAAERFGVSEDQVLVTAGADDALLRIALGFLGPERDLLLPTPTFEMIARYAALANARVVELPWGDAEPFPTERLLERVDARTSVVPIVSPNNPTGKVARPGDVRALLEGAPNALVVQDGAYAEFTDDDDLLAVTLEAPNGVALRTMSKAFGCAGLRVGFAIGDPDVIAALRASGNPYPVASPSLAAAASRMAADISPFVDAVRAERTALARALRELGADAVDSQANFVFARSPRADAIAASLARGGIAIRVFPGKADLRGAMRITCPGDEPSFARLLAALERAFTEEVAP